MILKQIHLAKNGRIHLHLKSEEVSSTDEVSSSTRKQEKVEGVPFQVPVEQSERATAALASSSLNPSTQDVVEYSLESAAPRDPRAKDRHYTQKTAALGEQIRRSYYSITHHRFQGLFLR